MLSTPQAIGQPLSRPDGRLKVTGAATYSAEWDVPDLAYGWAVTSTVARGRVASIDAAPALRAPGVSHVVSHLNAPRLRPLPDEFKGLKVRGEGGMIEIRQPLQDNEVFYAGQPVAVVVADTLEHARHAAALVEVTYQTSEPLLRLENATEFTRPETFVGGEDEPLQVSIGDPQAALAGAPVRVEQTYETPIVHHNPIELIATIARWEGGEGAPSLTLYDTCRYVEGIQGIVAFSMGLPAERVRVVSKFVGGSFGSKAWQWFNPILVALTARAAGRPVKIEWSRQMMFAIAGQRAHTVQTLSLGATREGKLLAIQHDTRTHSSVPCGYVEPCARMTRMMYATPALGFSHRLAHLNLPSPTPVRGPGDTPGSWALECAMDELAVELKMDPVELRLLNYAETNPETGKPWSSKNLRACYARGRELIGWDARAKRPAVTRENGALVGYGMATTMYPAGRNKASARATIFPDGRALFQSATHDQGNGAYTIFRQIGADAVSLPVESVRFDLGDSEFPPAPATGGSTTTATVGPAIMEAGRAALAALKRVAARDNRSPLFGLDEALIEARGGRLVRRDDATRGEDYGAIIRRANLPYVVAGAQSEGGPERDHYSFYSFGAVFARVLVDEASGTIRLAKLAGVYDVGRLMNPKTSRSQLLGGLIWISGMTLMEETIYDPRNGRAVIRNLADYHIPTMADTPEIVVETLGIPDPHINELGARGFGEIGCVGTAAAIANAVFHATGKRVRSLPLTPDKLV